MPPPNKRRIKALRVNRARNKNDDSDSADDEATPSALPAPLPAAKPASLRSEVAEKDARITELEAVIIDLRCDLLALQTAHEHLWLDTVSLLHSTRTVLLAHNALKTLKRKADIAHFDELGRRQKHIHRLEVDHTRKEERTNFSILALESSLYDNSACNTQLRLDLDTTSQLNSRDATINNLKASLLTKQTTLTETRNRLYAVLKQANRAKLSLKEIKMAYNVLRIWNPTEGGEYTEAACELARLLTRAGCAASKIEFAVKACAQAFGIQIRRCFMSARTVGRALEEGGKYAEMQVAREIMEAPGFVESSDGTSHHGLTYESCHVTLLAPSYTPNTDDSDQSTWTYKTRFMEVTAALDHTAQRQFDGTVEIATRMASTYSRSPLAARERRVMDKNEYWQKKLEEMKDHAADGKKAFRLSTAHKTDIVTRYLGRLAMDEADVATSHILLTMLSITNEDLADAGKLSDSELQALVTKQLIASVAVAAIKISTSLNTATKLFNAPIPPFDNVHVPPPVLLANKANTAAINNSGNDILKLSLRNAEKAEKVLKRREAAASKKKTKAAQLAATQLELDTNKINLMILALLKNQLAVYRNVLKNPILTKKPWKDMSTVAIRRTFVLEARDRELARKNAGGSEEPSEAGVEFASTVIIEFGFSEADDGEWVEEEI
ncbi:hypothetical protein B0H16DRAFT_1882430 [Mycena metata]|uniref:Uncharacterized protein n=1 Tax=Mycena metata TaxID=1033252 RepID=A0AAD7NML7_9AGAR|nr:hypothetical protein B0H16DRAFT_1882430 [Mycena metata]